MNFVLSRMGPFEHYKKPSPTGSIGYFDDNDNLVEWIFEEDCRLVANNGGTFKREFQAKWQKKIGEQLWDCSQFEQKVFDNVKRMIAIAAKYKVKSECGYLKLSITAFNNTSFHSNRIGPWTHNIQKKTFYKSLELSLPLVRKLVGEFGTTCLYDINEPEFGSDGERWRLPINGLYCFGDKAGTHKGTPYADLVKKGLSNSFGNVYWYAMVLHEFLRLGVKPENIISGCRFNYDPKTFDIDTETAVYNCMWEILRWLGHEPITKCVQVVHGCGGEGKDNTPFALHHWQINDTRPDVFISTDKTFSGTREKVLDPTGKFKRWGRQTPAEIYVMFKKIFESMAAGKTSKNWYLEILTYSDLFDESGEAVNRAYKESFGANLPGWGSYPTPIKPPVDPVVPPTPDPVEPPFSLQGEWNNNKREILISIGVVVILTLIAILVKC